jgi:DNA invertase Pin-like site-specific DNA recombinase
MCGVFAEFERGMIREKVNAGLASARSKGVTLGRRPVKPAIEARICALRAEGVGILKIGRTVGVGTSVVQRVALEIDNFIADNDGYNSARRWDGLFSEMTPGLDQTHDAAGS